MRSGHVKQEDSVAVHAKPVMSKGHAMGQIGGHGQWAYSARCGTMRHDGTGECASDKHGRAGGNEEEAML
jgi:hypothetical protein